LETSEGCRDNVVGELFPGVINEFDIREGVGVEVGGEFLAGNVNFAGLFGDNNNTLPDSLEDVSEDWGYVKEVVEGGRGAVVS
jgi:hypothetical protein